MQQTHTPNGNGVLPLSLGQPADAPATDSGLLARLEALENLAKLAFNGQGATPSPTPPAEPAAPQPRLAVAMTDEQVDAYLAELEREIIVYIVNNDVTQATKLSHQWTGAARAFGRTWAGKNPLDVLLKGAAIEALAERYGLKPEDVRWGKGRRRCSSGAAEAADSEGGAA